MHNGAATHTDPPTPSGPRRRRPWLVFGPGAIIASLTIGTGELIFSARGGALFGYRILSLFLLISLLKWCLVFGAARHFVLTGAHPMERLRHLPSPAGWFPALLLVLAAVSVPIWVAFHASVVGNLLAWVTNTRPALNGCAEIAWGAAILAAVIGLASRGGYTSLERAQQIVVALLVLVAGASLALYGPDWGELFAGALEPPALEYPAWLSDSHPDIAKQPVWVELTRYVGVIGGAGYDYLAYASFLRDKRWGRAGSTPLSRAELESQEEPVDDTVRQGLRATLADSVLSFLTVVGVSAVFVAGGHLALAPERAIPDSANLLNLQARIVTDVHPWLYPLYVAGAFLTMIGTLYATIEVGHTIHRESIAALRLDTLARTLRRRSLVWIGVGSAFVLGWILVARLSTEDERPELLVSVLTPANLFTGVLLCGLLSWAVVWMDRRFLPRALRPPIPLTAMLVVAGFTMIALGIKGYVDDETGTIAATVLAVGVVFTAGWTYSMGKR